MIINIIPAQSFSDELLYLFKDGSVMLFSNAVRTTPKEINADMEVYRSAKPDLQYPCLHLIVSFHAADNNKLTKEIMTDVGQEILKRFGATDKFQFVALQHKDGNNPHLHICLNRVGEDGKVLSDSFAKRRLSAIRQQLEREYPQLKIAKGKNIAETNMAKLKGADKIKYEIYSAITKEIPFCKSISDLITKLESTHLIKTEFKYKRGSSDIQGIKFNKESVWLKGSEIDKQCSYSKLVMQIEKANVQLHKEEETSTENEQHKNNPEVSGEPPNGAQLFHLIKEILTNEGNPEDDTILNKGEDFIRKTKGKKYRRM